MSEADKIFEDLGYRKGNGENVIVYEKIKKYKDREEGKPIREVIGFDTSRKQVYGFSDYDGIDYGLGIDIPIPELKAINKKCEELGWL